MGSKERAEIATEASAEQQLQADESEVNRIKILYPSGCCVPLQSNLIMQLDKDEDDTF